MSNIEMFRKRIVAGIEAGLASGMTLICGDYTQGTGACALAMTGRHEGGIVDSDDVAPRFFDLAYFELRYFINGFDGTRTEREEFRTATEAELYDFGKELREKYKPVWVFDFERMMEAC
jgi:hypothetical protein